MSRKNLLKSIILLFSVVIIGLILTWHAPVSKEEKEFNQLTNEYFDSFFFPNHPTDATMLGIHLYDDKMDDYSRNGIENRIALLKQYETKFANVNNTNLSEFKQGNHALVLNNIRSQLLTLEKIRHWEKNPDFYSTEITNSAFVIIERNFASAEKRLQDLIAREKQMPGILLEARKNLQNPPKLYTQIALEQLPGMINFFKKDVPKAFQNVQDAVLVSEFKQTNNNVIAALEAYQEWLTKDMLPKSNGDYKIGEQVYREKLLYDEMVDIPLDDLLVINKGNMRQNQEDFAKIAKEVEPTKTPEEVLAILGADHPKPDQLLKSFSDRFDNLIKFIRDKQIISIPSKTKPIMEETPPFMRATTFASMDTPGPFEKRAKEAYFNVTLPDPNLTQNQQNEYMTFFNYPSINNTAVHEAYPGHYVQFLWMHFVPGRVRKILGSNTNAEGWAHYCEQMILDEGFAQPKYGVMTEREAKFLRLGQLGDALLRNARFTVGIELHRGKMTFDQAVDYFVKEGYQARIGAIMETKRAASDPTYLYYTLGKLQILKLRADMEKKLGAKFNLQKFHDDFMRQGYPPIKIVRKAMLGDDSPTL